MPAQGLEGAVDCFGRSCETRPQHGVVGRDDLAAGPRQSRVHRLTFGWIPRWLQLDERQLQLDPLALR